MAEWHEQEVARVAPDESRELIGTQGFTSHEYVGQNLCAQDHPDMFPHTRHRARWYYGTGSSQDCKILERQGAYLMKWIGMRPHTI
jgi:hypothetical protein